MIRRPLTTALLAVLATCAPAAPAAAADDGDACTWKKYTVRSPATGKIERFWVGHRKDLDAGAKHPAIYFLPGLLDSDDTWKRALDPHLAKHDIVAVCPAVGGATWFMNSPRQPWMKWGDFLTGELRAFIQVRYPVSPEKGQRGVAGISAGGHAAFYHAITKPDLYGSVTVLSGSMDLRPYAGAVGLDYWIGPRTGPFLQQYKERSCVVLAGEHEGPLPFALALEAGDRDGALPLMETFRRVLDAKGLTYRWHVGGGGHNWTFWTSRTPDVLAWHAEQFDANRRANRYAAEVPPGPDVLEVLDGLPQIGLSDEALARLRAPWTEATTLQPVKTGGIPDAGAPLRRGATEEPFAEAAFGADLPAGGHGAGLFVYRLTLTVASPLPQAGTVALAGVFRNGRRGVVLRVPAAHLPVPAGDPQRKADLHARLVVELKEPDPIRGGIVVAVQPFDADGHPAGDPAVGTARPGHVLLERWTVAPKARTLWTVTLTGPSALPLAAVHTTRIEAEP
jgi:S-formylglutathione hydrolase FrmB